jgi:hypothetical protein
MPLPPPWKSGYAIPGYIKNENLERGARVTAMLPRGTIFTGGIPPGDAGYVLPSWVKREPLGRGVFTTNQLPRGTGYPKNAQNPAPVSSLSGSSLGGSSLGGSSLGGSSLGSKRLGKTGGRSRSSSKDGVANYGLQAADLVLRQIDQLPSANDKRAALSAALEKIQSGLYNTVEQKTAQYAAKGYSPREALRRALAASMANGLAAEIIKLGKGSSSGFAGLGATGVITDHRTGDANASAQVVYDGRTYKGIRKSDGNLLVAFETTSTPGWENLGKKLGPKVAHMFEDYTQKPWSSSMAKLLLATALAGQHNIGSYDSKHSFYIRLYKKVGNRYVVIGPAEQVLTAPGRDAAIKDV